jgi:hypothetical protein
MSDDSAKKRPPENVGPRGAEDSDVFPGAIGRFAAVVADSFPHVWKPPDRHAKWAVGILADPTSFVVRSNLRRFASACADPPAGLEIVRTLVHLNPWRSSGRENREMNSQDQEQFPRDCKNTF